MPEDSEDKRMQEAAVTVLVPAHGEEPVAPSPQVVAVPGGSGPSTPATDGRGAVSNGVLVAQSFSGPLPPPDALAAYGAISPDLIDRVVGMAERQSQHRQNIEREIVRSGTSNSRLGIQCGFVLGLTGLLAAVAMVALGSPVAGAVIGGADLVGLVSVFIFGTARNRREGDPEDKDSE